MHDAKAKDQAAGSANGNAAEPAVETGFPDAQEGPSSEPIVLAEIAQVLCWRCGKPMPTTSATCPVCRATARASEPEGELMGTTDVVSQSTAISVARAKPAGVDG